MIPVGDDDQLLLYTDGVSEARDAAGRFFPLAQATAKALNTAGALRLSRTPAASSAPDGLNVNRARARDTLRAGAAPHLAVAAFLC